MFWEPGGAVVPGACVIDRLAIDVRRADLAAYLLEARDRLEQLVASITAMTRKARGATRAFALSAVIFSASVS